MAYAYKNEYYRDLFDSVLAYISERLNAQWLSNPELVDGFIEANPTLPDRLNLQFVMLAEPVSEFGLRESIESLGAPPNTVHCVILKGRETPTFKGYFLNPSPLGHHLTSICSSEIETKVRTFDEMANAKLYIRRIISTLVYDARKKNTEDANQRDNHNALSHPEITKGSVIKNISLFGSNYSTVKVTDICPDSNTGETVCKLWLKKRGTRKEWIGQVPPRKLAIALHNRDAMKRITPDKDGVSTYVIDLVDPGRVDAGGHIQTGDLLAG